jgi:hypothetical protein
MRALAFACGLAAALSPLTAQHEWPQVVAPANGAHGTVLATKDGLVLPAGEFTVTDLVDSVARFLCRNYLFDATALDKVPGFTLQRSLALDAIGSEELLYALLAARDLAALPVDELRGVYQIVPLAPDRRTLPITNVPWRMPDEILRRPRLRELVMTLVTLEHADAEQLANALRAQFALQGMWQPGVPTASAAGNDTLLLHGYRDQIAPLLALVQQIDRAARQAQPAAAAADAVQARVARLERELAELRREVQAMRATAPSAANPTQR